MFPRLGLALLCLASLPASSAPLPGLKDPGHALPDLQHVRFSRFDTSDGLTSSSVSAVIQDRHGVMWLGTDSGLCRFDGSEILSIRIPTQEGDPVSHDRVTALVNGSDEEIWVGTSNRGLCRLDSASGDLRLFSENALLPGQEIRVLALDAQGFLWVGTGKGLARIHPNRQQVEVFEASTGGARVAAIEADPRGDVWVGLMDGRLFHYRRVGGRFLMAHRFDSPVASLAVDRRNGLWIGCDGTGLFRLSTEQAKSLDELCSA